MARDMVVVVGEALIDVVVDPDGDTEETPGGSPLNVAVGLSRLDVPATLITQVGHDERGGMILQHVEASGVEIVAAPPSSGRTSTAIARLDRAGLARYEFDLEWSLPRQELPALPGAARRLAGHGARAGPRERARPRRAGRRPRPVRQLRRQPARELRRRPGAHLARGAGARRSRCTLVKLSDEDAELLAADADPDEVARALLDGRAHRAGAADPRGPGRHRVHDDRDGLGAASARSRWSTRSVPATPSWPARWPSSATSTRSVRG